MPDPTLWTIRGAMLLYAASLATLLVAATNRSLPTRLPPTDARANWYPLARRAYALGWLLYVLHVVAAFHFRHGWSHAAATENVSAQSLATAGVDSGFGIWLNHLFTLVWTMDLADWWLRGDAAHAGRPRFAAIGIHAFMLFIVVNASIVFPAGPTRVAGIAIAAVLVLLTMRRWSSSRRQPRPDALF